MFNWLRKLTRSKQPEAKERNAKPANWRIKHAGYTTYQQPEQNPVLVRGKFWKNTEENRWELSRDDLACSDSSVEGLIKQLAQIDKTEVRRSAAERLGQMGQSAVPAISTLVKASIDIDATVRDATLQALDAIDPSWQENVETRKAIPCLVKAIKSWSSDVSRTALGMLHRIGPPAIPDLVEALLKGEDTTDKVFIIRLLAQIGPNAEDAIPGLTKALCSQFLQVRVAAANALANEGKAAKTAVPILIAGLKDSFSDGRQAMATCLAQIGEDAEPAIPSLLPLLADRDDKVRGAAATALENIGPNTIPALIELVQARDAQRLKVQNETMTTVSQWCNHPDLGIPVFEPGKVLNNLNWAAYELLQNQENLEAAQRAALRLLGKFGTAASSAEPTIIQALSDSNPSVQLAAAKALCKIDCDWITNPTSDKAIMALTKQLNSTKELGETAIFVFAGIGAGAVPILIQVLENGEQVARENAAIALGQIGRDSEPAIPALTTALREDNRKLQEEINKALAKIKDDISKRYVC